jgi:hypothetical protein
MTSTADKQPDKIGKGSCMAESIDWREEVVEDYRQRLIVDPDSPILAHKANRDRYNPNLPNQARYAGLSHLGSKQSEDALTWNVFRSLQKSNKLNIVCDRLRIGAPRGLLLWRLAPDTEGTNAELQWVVGATIRRFDGRLDDQEMTEPDVTLLGTAGIALVECKLSRPGNAPRRFWEGKSDRVARRLPIYNEQHPRLLKPRTGSDDVAPVYQLMRMAFYATEIGARFGVEPVVVSLANNKNWTVRYSRKRHCAADLWKAFIDLLGDSPPRCEALFWQDLLPLISDESMDALSQYLSTHPCL